MQKQYLKQTNSQVSSFLSLCMKTQSVTPVFLFYEEKSFRN